MATAHFLVIEFPGIGEAHLDFTRRNPGVTIDTLSEPGADVGGDRIHPTTILVKGADAEQLQELSQDLERAYGAARTLERDMSRGLWLARVMVRESALRDRGIQGLLQFQHRFGVPWSHMEGGVLHLKARVPDFETGEQLARQVRGYLSSLGIDAQVQVQEIDAHDYSVWTDLVDHTLGLSQ